MGLLKAIGIAILALFCLLGILIFAGAVYVLWPLLIVFAVLALPIIIICLLI